MVNKDKPVYNENTGCRAGVKDSQLKRERSQATGTELRTNQHERLTADSAEEREVRLQQVRTDQREMQSQLKREKPSTATIHMHITPSDYNPIAMHTAQARPKLCIACH